MNARKWLFVAAVITEVTGILMVIGSLVPGAYAPLLELLFGAPVADAAPTRLGFGIAGAVMTGWAVTIALLVRRLDALSPAALGTAVAAGVAAWFVLDAIASIGNGAALNLVGNTLFLALLLPPSLALRGGSRPAG